MINPIISINFGFWYNSRYGIYRDPIKKGRFWCVKVGHGRLVNPKRLETGLRPNNAGIPSTLVLGIEASGFPTLGLLL